MTTDLGQMFVRLGEDADYAAQYVSGGERLSALLRAAQRRLWYHLSQQTRVEVGCPDNPNDGMNEIEEQKRRAGDSP